MEENKIPRALEEARDMARSEDGLTSIILHFLGYKLPDQSDLTLPQKIFLREAYFYYQEIINPKKQKTPGESVREDVKREVEKRYG